MDHDHVNAFNVQNTNADGDFNYILEVDLHYPDSLHDTHTDFPLAGMKFSKKWYNILVYCNITI